MLSRKGLDSILQRIYESSTLSEELERDIDTLRNDFVERQDVFDSYGLAYEGEDESYDMSELRKEREDTKDWKAQYEDLHKRYVTRFFSPTASENMEEKEEVTEEETYDELLKKEE